MRDDVVYMRTTEGPKRVDVIYRRIDDEFLDPLAFRPDSALGVPGLMSAYQAGNVTLANAVGTGVADDKAVYSYMPEIIRFYLGEEPILKNVPTWRCRETDALRLRARPSRRARRQGGRRLGRLRHAGRPARRQSAEIEAFRREARRQPGRLHRPADARALDLPDLRRRTGIAPRHVDLRPFVLSGADKVRIVPGGLTRVALKEGSLVVNSSQGGGTKDTWVLDG